MSSTGLTIGRTHEIQKLQIQKVHLGETPNRIAYQAATSTLGLLTTRETSSSLEADFTGHLRLLNAVTFEIVDGSAALPDVTGRHS